MTKKSENLTCVVTGDEIYYPGTKNDAIYERFVPDHGFHEYDSMITELGAVARRAIPVYERAVNESMGANSDTLILERLQDRDFIIDTLREEVANKIQELLNAEFYDERDARFLKNLLLNCMLNKISLRDIVDEELVLTEGALSPNRAQACLLDDGRTFKFLKALLIHLQDLERSKDNIELVDAGSGPIPLFGLVAALLSKKVNVTCLEIVPASARKAEEIIKSFHLEDRVKVLCTDASTYQHDKDIDFLISETMYSGLTEEPIADILNNLSSQVSEDAVIMPEWVSVDVGLVSREKLSSLDGRVSVSELDFGPVEVIRFTRGKFDKDLSFIIPIDDSISGSHRLALMSKLGLYGDKIVLSGQDSFITAPTLVGDANKPFIDLSDCGEAKNLHVSYSLGDSGENVRTKIA